MNIYTLPILPQIGIAGNDVIMTATVAELAAHAKTIPNKELPSSWNGNVGTDKSAEMMEHGDLSTVPASDAFMSQFEDVCPAARAFRVESAVSGGAVNVGAFLAGSPECMRNRRRQETQTGPLCIVADISSSASITAQDIKRRGLAILALVRLLSATRPVELYVTVTLGTSVSDALHILIKLETAPLDLARAAHVLTHASVDRAVSMPVMRHMHKGANESWPYSSVSTYRKYAPQIFGRVIDTSAETIYLAPPHSFDPIISNPVQWVKDMLAKYGSAQTE